MTMAPVSFQQQEMLQNMQRYPQCALRYNLLYVLKISGQINVNLLQRALDETIGRHEALRTSILAQRGSVRQRICDAQAIEPTPLVEGAGIKEIVDSVRSLRLEADDVFAGHPLFRAGISHIGQTCLLWIIAHHLVFDGWSEGVFWHDLSENYRALLKGYPARLTPLSNTYADFARWQRNYWQQHKGNSVFYWKQLLNGYPAKLSWPRPAQKTIYDATEIAISNFKLDSPRAAAVKEIARIERVTPFQVLAAAAAITFYQVTGVQDIIIGTTTANREEKFKRGMIGHFANRVLLPLRIETNSSLRGMAQQVRDRWLDAERYREVYSAQLLDSVGQPEFVNVNFTLHNEAYSPLQRLCNAKIEFVPIPTDGYRDWRDLSLLWELSSNSHLTGSVVHRLCGVSDSAVSDIIKALQMVFLEH
jgi:hypothetical protein